jgi:hypothetical protein
MATGATVAQAVEQQAAWQARQVASSGTSAVTDGPRVVGLPENDSEGTPGGTVAAPEAEVAPGAGTDRVADQVPARLLAPLYSGFLFRDNGKDWTPKPGVPPEDIANLEAIGAECELKLPGSGKVLHLVPVLTGEPRLEMTYREAATIRALVDVIPGAVLKGFKRTDREI